MERTAKAFKAPGLLPEDVFNADSDLLALPPDPSAPAGAAPDAAALAPPPAQGSVGVSRAKSRHLRLSPEAELLAPAIGSV
jgi:hypothetical protein